MYGFQYLFYLRGKETDSSHPLVHSQDAHNTPEQEFYSIRSPTWEQGVHFFTNAVFPGCTSVGSQNQGPAQYRNRSNLEWDMDVVTGVLTSRLNALCKLQNSLLPKYTYNFTILEPYTSWMM